MDTSRPYPALEVPIDVSSNSSIESPDHGYHICTQVDDSRAYHGFINNTMDDLAAQGAVGEKNLSTKDLVGDAFIYEPSICPSPVTARTPTNITFSIFAPYIKLFLEYLYPIMPVFDRNILLADLTFRIDDPSLLSLEEMALFSALSAAVIVQLNIIAEDENATPKGSPLDFDGAKDPTKMGTTAESFISQCLSVRQRSNFIDSPTINWLLTSFFLFDYYGNLQEHTTAWYYLREAMGLALELRLDVEELYRTEEPSESQRRKRIFWLLFITERGYALQRRRTVSLQPSISLPLIFDSENPRLLYGFVSLISLFKFVDRRFSHMCGNDSLSSSDGQPVEDADELSSWIVSFQENISRVSVPLPESIETQRVDIMVTRAWLHTVAWQLSVRLGLLTTCGDAKSNNVLHLRYPFVLAKELVTVISGTQAKSLEFHGDGMEQKISQIAMCLADVMACICNELEPDPNGRRTGESYLRVFLGLLSKFRGRRSSYLDSILTKALPFISDTPCNQPSILKEASATSQGKYPEDKSSTPPHDDTSVEYLLL
ncbi:hypothetical protein TWF718_007684 [Orbilia javanica]|uniref:Xylanolytic transcriptional activator regulatory domain-containing protein n=1 Tax=Orbilia javanica TaxID=47235 RepID=A0AAN8RNR1_9PEZI